MGLPVTLAIFGHLGMFYMVVLNCLFNVFIFTLGVWNVKKGVSYSKGDAGDARPAGALREMLKNVINPVIIALFVGFFLLLTQIHLPQAVADVLDSVGAMMAPLSMMVIGLQLTESKIGDVITNGRLVAMSAIRLIGIGGLCFALLLPFYLNGSIPPLLIGVLILNLILPCAAVPVMFAEEYGGNVKITAEGTFLSTLFSIATIPVAGMLLATL
jgi:predicted permease